MEFSAVHMKLSILSLVDDRAPAAAGTGDGNIGGLIFLRVQKQKEPDICYRIQRKTPLRALMLDYCNRMGLIFDAVRFTFDGKRVPGHKTATDLGLDDDDIIDAWTEQMGG